MTHPNESTKRLKADLETAALREDVQRLIELRRFLTTINNAGNRRRVAEITEQLKRIDERLAELADVA